MNNSKVKKNFSTKIDLKKYFCWEIIKLFGVLSSFDDTYLVLEDNDMEIRLYMSCHELIVKRRFTCDLPCEEIFANGRETLIFYRDFTLVLEKEEKKVTLKYDLEENTIALKSNDSSEFFDVLSKISDALKYDEHRFGGKFEKEKDEFNVKVEYTKS